MAILVIYIAVDVKMGITAHKNNILHTLAILMNQSTKC